MDVIRILLAEDHELVRAGLRLLIESQPGFAVVCEAGDGLIALEEIARHHPDIVILDLSMPRLNGIELMSRLQSLSDRPKVITLTANEDPAYLRQLFQLGVSGYLLKRSAADELIRAIRTVAAGDRFLGANLIDVMVDQFAVTAPPILSGGTENLTDRESAVLKMIASGMTNKEVSARLDISIKTVETYKSRAMQKLQLRGRTDIVRYAVSHGWLTPT